MNRNLAQPAPRQNQQGVVLLAALIAVVIVAAMSAAMFSTAQAEMKQAQNYRVKNQVFHLAEAGAIAAEQQLLTAVANTLPPPPTGNVALGNDVASFAIAQVGPDTVVTDADGIQTIHRNYQIDAVANFRGYSKTVHRVVDVGLTPIFQYAIFYDRDLELLPGPSMVLSGRVHSNQDIYVGVGNGSTLTIDSNYFRSVGSIFRKRKNDGTLTGGTVNLRKRNTGSFYEMYSHAALSGLGVPSVSGYDSDFLGYDANSNGIIEAGDWEPFNVGSLSTWDGTLQTGDHGMNRVEPPSIGSIKRFEAVPAAQGDYTYDSGTDTYTYVGAGNGDHRKGRYHDNAGLVIRDGNGFDAAGNPVALPVGAVTERTFYDGREQQNVTVTEINVGLLGAAFPANGLIYASRSDSDIGQPNGIRLVNGGTLPAALTVATENPLYIKGDYNRNSKKPASVIADAVNLMSNNWNDTKTAGTLPGAAETWFNTAIITGGPETVSGQYNGGFENLPRFHENWNGVRAHILGSFVKIYGSEIAQGDWVYGGDRYTAPLRMWDYDNDFNNAANLPPFTPNVAQVRNAGWWE